MFSSDNYNTCTVMCSSFLTLGSPRDTEPRYRPPGQRWILDGGLRGGVPGRPPFWRTPEESCTGLGSVSFKINTQHTLTFLGNHVPEHMYSHVLFLGNHVTRVWYVLGC